MVTVATELARALVADRDGDAYTLLCSRERPPSLRELDCEAVLALVPLGVSRAVEAGPLPAAVEPGFILAVGTVEPRKNYPRLLAAYRRLRERKGGAPPLVIAGRPGWAYGDTLNRIRAEPGVRYLGHVDDRTLSALYEAAGALAFPSLYEGFGLPLLEAMAHGVPCVAGNTGALPEPAGDAALLVHPEAGGATEAAL